MVISWPDGECVELTPQEYQKIEDDLRSGIPNKIYEVMKAKKDQGIIDTNGLVYLLEAYATPMEELWGDYDENETE